MSKTFTYTADGKMYCVDDRDICMYDSIDFEYEVDDDKLLDDIVDLLYNEYFEDKLFASEEKCKQFKKAFGNLISDFDFLDDLVDKYEDTIKDMHEEEALNSCDY
jgi:hypothetical protein